MTNQPSQQLIEAKSYIEESADLSAELIKAMGMSTEQFARIAINSLIRNPKLANCDQKSLKLAVMTCAQDGLIPDGVQAALVPFKNEVQYIPMYSGLLTLARESIKSVSINVPGIFKGDEWEYEEGLEPKLFHKPAPLDGDVHIAKTWANLIAIYGIVRYPGSSWPEFEVMSKADLEFHKKTYVKALKGPWSHPVDAVAMGKKTVLLRLLKRLPRRGKLAYVLDREYEMGDELANSSMQVPENTQPEPVPTPDQADTEPQDAEIVDAETTEEQEVSDAEAQTVNPGIL